MIRSVTKLFDRVFTIAYWLALGPYIVIAWLVAVCVLWAVIRFNVAFAVQFLEAFGR